MGLKEVLAKTEKVEPIAELNGVKVVTFEEQRDLAQLDALQKPDLGILHFNPDGSVAATPTRFAAVNLEHYYINRYKKVKNELYVVTDYRAIKEQADGRVYLKQIPAFVIGRDSNGNLQLSKMVTVSDTEFVSDFTHTLNNNAMKQIMPLLVSGPGISQDDLSI